MFVVIVKIHVKTEFIEEFIAATLNNVSNSIKEPGVARFDFYQQEDDPSQFTLIEIYRTEGAPNMHRETDHYVRWNEKVASMMAESRAKTKYNILYPNTAEW